MICELRKAITLKDKLYRQAKLSQTDTDESHYKRQRNTVNNMKKHARQLFSKNFNDTLETLNTHDSQS